MESGIQSPLTVTAKGGASMVSGSDLIRQLLLAALRDCSSANPFQSLGISDRVVFDVADGQTLGQLKVVIQQIFVQFEAQKLARLVRGEDGVILSHNEDGEVIAKVNYIDLETDKPDTVSASHNENGWS